MTISDSLENKTLFVTGGTGSFGSAFIRKILESYQIKRLIVYSRDEKKQHDIRSQYADDNRLRCITGDIRDKNALQKFMRGVDIVFHAAALKQVPNCEFFPLEAIHTNILGAQNVIDAARYNNISNLIFLSTDKAVYPINVMGMTKALMERLLIAESRFTDNGTVFSATRYGNVMYTRGSVILHFINQIQNGRPLTITNPSMTRFLKTIEHSIELVLYALTQKEQGVIYIKKSPASTINTIAQALCEIFEYNKGTIEIGIRPGEKMHETLISHEELSRTVDCGDYYKIYPEVSNLDHNAY